MTKSAIRVSEIFGPTVQGEGALIGKPTVFVRTGGCDFRCSWCDTLHAVLPAHRHDWSPMTPEENSTAPACHSFSVAGNASLVQC